MPEGITPDVSGPNDDTEKPAIPTGSSKPVKIDADELWDETDGVEGTGEDAEGQEKEVDDFKANPNELRKIQIDQYLRLKDDPKAPIIADKNEPGSPRTYKALTHVWSPLILDVAGQAPWTVEEIYEALQPILNKFSREYGGLRAAYQQSDAFSDGVKAMFQCLEKDRGRAPFGLYAADMIKKKMQRGAKASGIIPIPTRKRTFTDKSVTSTDVSSELGKNTIGAAIPDATPIINRTRCPNCAGSGKQINPETKEQEVCQVCNGDGNIILPEPRKILSPDEQAVENERQNRAKLAVSQIISLANLSQRLDEILLLHFGVEGAYDPTITNTGEPKMATAIAYIMGVADKILRKPSQQEGQTREVESGIWLDAEKQGRTAEFQQIWNSVFGDEEEHHPFDPELPVSLQIAPLYNVEAEGSNKDRLLELFERLWTTFRPDMPMPPAPRKMLSKQWAVNNLNKIHERVERIIKSGTPQAQQLRQMIDAFSRDYGLHETGEGEVSESIASCQYAMILDGISKGRVNIDDIRDLGYMI